MHFWDPQPPRGRWFFTRNRYLYWKNFYQVDFWGTRGSQPDALRDHSGTVFGPKSPQKIVFGDFHDHGVEVWVQGAFGTVFCVVPSTDFDFFGSAGDPGAPRAVAGLQRADADIASK